jgi:hypothetical protein
MSDPYRTDMYQEYVVWRSLEGGPWSQHGFWICGMFAALQHTLDREYDQINDDLREVAPWYWTCRAELNGREWMFVLVRRGDAPDPTYMPWNEPIEEPRERDETFRRIAPPKL